MAEIHEIIERFGAEEARHLSTPQQVRAACTVMSEENDAFGATYSGFALTSFPHKRLPMDATWERHGGPVRLLVEPGRLPNADGGYTLYGVPYGAQARLIMIYLQTQALRTGARTVSIGSSMYDWIRRMGITRGGRTYTMVRDQALRISACHLTFTWQNGKRLAFESEKIVRGGILDPSRNDGHQRDFWPGEVRLSEAFFEELLQHAVPLSEEALAQISNAPMTIDIYLWLAYRLHALDKPTPITWRALMGQFGPDYSRVRDFKRRFASAWDMALAVYPDARARRHEEGVTLHPSRPPVAPRSISMSR